ncbi:peroxidase-related enzyme [Aureimonas fodinaquatilis]|uniref:Peroxidase-related enzyme n=1 Tax=Aureimonas fodinaquatilis TaxID=2565783 RepID=A0A5B0DUC5_9HYPH|nr:peroxidase-related enzyme [Aureimonas fodinaquatilis]KAA0970417.1 peroxidase-related enzyme [Aureimonas fodinaquatilis]
MSQHVVDFTLDELDWHPRVRPIILEGATAEQRDAMKITPSATQVSDYILVLAQEAPMLNARSPLFNEIMYGKDGLSRGGREMGALAASIVNECIFCASVHARRHVQLEKRSDVIETILRDKLDADLHGLDRALFDFSVALTRKTDDPAGLPVAALRNAGLDDLEILDLVHSIAVFGWANRLMHTLGEPRRK